MNDDNKMIELRGEDLAAVSGGNCPVGEYALLFDSILLGSTFSGSDPVKFVGFFCNG